MTILEWVGKRPAPAPAWHRGKRDAEEVVFKARDYTMGRVTAIVEDPRIADFLVGDEIVEYDGPLNPAALPDEGVGTVDWDQLLPIAWENAGEKAQRKLLKDIGIAEVPKKPKLSAVETDESPAPRAEGPKWLAARSDGDVCAVAERHGGEQLEPDRARAYLAAESITAKMFDHLLQAGIVPA